MEVFQNYAYKAVISAARPGQGGEGHFNEQPPEYWVKQFGDYGFQLELEKTDQIQKVPEIFNKNMLVFSKRLP